MSAEQGHGGLTESFASEILHGEVGSGWVLSAALGTTQAVRIASRDGRSVIVKMLDTPAEIMSRLSDLEVTPAVIALGERAGIRYMIQEAVDGPHPDHSWFRTNWRQWAQMISHYLHDGELASLLAAQTGFWRLDVPAAMAMTDRDLDRAPKRTAALRSSAFMSALSRWRQQASSLPAMSMRPIHPDPHWHNYVIDEGRPLLLDWDHIDLSDPLRDVGYQVWGFLPERYWSEFLAGVGLPVEEGHEQAICWWAGFKLLNTAFFNDHRGDHEGARSHIDMFLIAADNLPWLAPEGAPRRTSELARKPRASPVIT